VVYFLGVGRPLNDLAKEWRGEDQLVDDDGMEPMMTKDWTESPMNRRKDYNQEYHLVESTTSDIGIVLGQRLHQQSKEYYPSHV
jgi:hypothetical protein